VLIATLASAQVQPKQTKSAPKRANKASDYSNRKSGFAFDCSSILIDAVAHKQLIDLLRKKNAFRAIVTDDARWLSNNRTDFLAVIELVSFADVALNDPEFAIAQLRETAGKRLPPRRTQRTLTIVRSVGCQVTEARAAS